MKLHNLNTKKDFKTQNLCLCIGNFDGIHLGHQHVIKKIINNSHSNKLKSAIMTFVPHPKIYFKKTDSNFNIITNKYKLITCKRNYSSFSINSSCHNKTTFNNSNTGVSNNNVCRNLRIDFFWSS